ncbi:MAG: NAD(P)-dependent oxidoreductase [Myxococcales bacterium]|nr:NAD(P)-dependent oxidoreductase [Myxococcales bacterium]
MKKRVLVTGARGFVGEPCVRLLVEQGWDVVAVSSAAPGGIAPEVAWRQVDLLDETATRSLVADVRPSHLLHSAWKPVHGDVMRSVINVDWLKASLSLVQAFREEGGERALVVGSSTEYDWDQGTCTNGVTPMRPKSIYGACKLSLQIALSAYAEATGMGFVWPRVFFVYGPGENETRLAASVIASVVRGQPAECTEGLQRRDYMHVDDVAAGIVAALKSDHQGPIDIASGHAIAVRDLALAIARAAGREDLVKLGARPSPPYLPPLVVGDASEAERVLGWKQTIGLEEGIAQTVAWGRDAFGSE